MNHNDDSIQRRLRREAMDQRPEFSRDLHERIMRHVPPQRTRWSWAMPMLAAAAAIALAAAGYWIIPAEHPRSPSALVAPVVKAGPARGAQIPALATNNLSVRIGGLVSARLWPPAIGVDVPKLIAKPQATAQPSRQTVVSHPATGAPGGVLASFEHPSASAKRVLAEALPPEVRVLIAMARPDPATR